jgi:hypothetical protein
MTLRAAHLLLTSLLPLAAAAGEEASIGQVLAACDRGASQGGQGVDAAICEWYLAPCDCGPKRAASSGQAPWCIPPGESVEAQVAAVRAELERAPDPTLPVGPAVEQILRQRYPCPAP